MEERDGIMKRFILIEDNRIIDITNLPYNEEYIIGEVDGEECLEFYDFFPDTEEQYYWSCYKIIKESDNLIDLIEIGDLVEIVETSISIKREYMGFTEGRGWICLEGCPFFRIDEFEDNLLKIYKPNKITRGYDLVWEKKE